MNVKKKRIFKKMRNSKCVHTSLCCFDLATVQYALNASSIFFGSDFTSSVNVSANSLIVATHTGVRGKKTEEKIDCSLFLSNYLIASFSLYLHSLLL